MQLYLNMTKVVLERLPIFLNNFDQTDKQNKERSQGVIKKSFLYWTQNIAEGILLQEKKTLRLSISTKPSFNKSVCKKD